MSRYYEMNVNVTGFDATKESALIAAMQEEWKFPKSDFWVHVCDGVARMGATGRDNLCGGEREEDFAERITEVIWRVNRAYCHVEVNATYLDELPYNTYVVPVEQYAKLRQEQT